MKVNLYKLKAEKIKWLIDDLDETSREKYKVEKNISKKEINLSTLDSFLLDLRKEGYTASSEKKYEFDNKIFKTKFFLNNESLSFTPEWKWVSSPFFKKPIKYKSNPKGMLLVTYQRNYYVYTFGLSYSIADKYCDREFGFNFAKRLGYENIQLVSKIAPHSKNNKTIDSFIHNENLFFDSGEAYTKIKGKATLKSNFNIFKENVEIGTSIKLHLYEDTIDNMLNIIKYISDLIKNMPEVTPIPLLKLVSSKEKELLRLLNQELALSIKMGKLAVSFSEFDIKGTIIDFISVPDYFVIRSGHKSKKIETLDILEIKKFIKEKKIPDNKILDIIIVSIDGDSECTYKIIEMVDYSDDKRRCVLINGKWYKFNDNYQKYLMNSLNEIDVYYDSTFNYSKSDHKKYLKNI